MSQDPNIPNVTEGKSDVPQDNQQDHVDNAEQCVRKKIQQNTPNPSRSNISEGKQNYSDRILFITSKIIVSQVSFCSVYLCSLLLINGTSPIPQKNLRNYSL